MSAFATVVAAVERVSRVRRRFAAKVIADCPLCVRPRRLEIVQQPSGRVVFICHAGCDREAVRERIGLGWPEFFDDVPYRPAPKRSAAQHVLHAVDGTRWTIVTHAFSINDRDLALAVEVIERLLPARHAARHVLRLRSGAPIEWDVFPLAVGFFIDMANALGQQVGEHRARRSIHLLVQLGLIERVGTLAVDTDLGPKYLPMFRLGIRTRRSWDEQLRQAQETASVLRSLGPSRDPATGTLLSAPDLLSTLRDEVEKQLRVARDAMGVLGRSPPETHVVGVKAMNR